MRVQIMTDMEGVSGIIAWDQVSGGKPMYEEGRRLYTEEINAAVRGADAAGATEIVVVDCHGAGGPWTFNSLVPELLDPRCDWVAGHTWSHYTDTLEAGCDAVLLVGMHAKAGTADGVLSHTISTVLWRHLWFNGQAVGEVGVNAAACGYYKRSRSPRDRRRGRLSRIHRTPRRRIDHCRRQERTLPLRSPPDSP